MSASDHIALLSLIIALAAYVGGVRLALMSRTTSDPDKTRRALRWLIPADAALIMAGMLTFLRFFWTDLFGGTAPVWFNPVIVWSFFAGVIVLAAQHVAMWFRAFRPSKKQGPATALPADTGPHWWQRDRSGPC